MPMYRNDLPNSNIEAIITHPHFTPPDIFVRYAGGGQGRTIEEKHILAFINKCTDVKNDGLNSALDPITESKIKQDFPHLFPGETDE